MIDMTKKDILPCVSRQIHELADTVIAVREAGADSSVQSETLTDVTSYLKETKKALNVLVDASL